jgi:hypothetical protein
MMILSTDNGARGITDLLLHWQICAKGENAA